MIGVNSEVVISMAVLPVVVSLVVTFAICLIFVKKADFLKNVIRDRDDLNAIQSSFVEEPLRLGGVAVLLGMIAGLSPLIGLSEGKFTQYILASLGPVFIAGLLEDLGFRVSASRRYFFSVVASLLVVATQGIWITRADLPVLDQLMAEPLVAIVISVFFASVFCHSVNLIDGLNGLSTSIVLTSAVGIMVLAARTEQNQILVLSFLMASSTLIFLVFNWPRGFLFLGDAGAYGLGHLLVWMAIALVGKNEIIAVPAVLLIVFYPCADTLHTVLRRLFNHKPIMRPDKMHLHQKIRRFLELHVIRKSSSRLSNPLASALMVPFFSAPVVTGIFFWDRPNLAWVFWATYFLLFCFAHVLIVFAAKKL